MKLIHQCKGKSLCFRDEKKKRRRTLKKQQNSKLEKRFTVRGCTTHQDNLNKRIYSSSNTGSMKNSLTGRKLCNY